MSIQIETDDSNGCGCFTAFALIVLLTIAALLVGGCASTDHIRESTKMVQIDTVYISSVVHDTTKTVEVVHDSVDRVVERTVYVDSNGVIHEKEVDRLTRYINRNAEVYESTTRLLEQRISQLKEQLQKKQETKIVEKKVYVLWPLWVAIGIVAVIVGGWFLLKRELSRMEKEED